MVTLNACRAMIQRQQGLCQPTREECAIEIVETVSKASILPPGRVEGEFVSYDTFDFLTLSRFLHALEQMPVTVWVRERRERHRVPGVGKLQSGGILAAVWWCVVNLHFFNRAVVVVAVRWCRRRWPGREPCLQSRRRGCAASIWMRLSRETCLDWQRV